jgi:hypothetical protein
VPPIQNIIKKQLQKYDNNIDKILEVWEKAVNDIDPKVVRSEDIKNLLEEFEKNKDKEDANIQALHKFFQKIYDYYESKNRIFYVSKGETFINNLKEKLEKDVEQGIFSGLLNYFGTTTNKPTNKSEAKGSTTPPVEPATLKGGYQIYIFGAITIAGIISTIVLAIMYALKPAKTADTSGGTCTDPGPGPGPDPNPSKSVYTKEMVNELIVETTRLNNSYNILYDNKNVDYRHSYYKNLSITTMQKWKPYFINFYFFILVLYAVALVIFQRQVSITEKIKKFVFVAIITNVYVLKVLISFLIVVYNKLKGYIPQIFMY